MLAWKATLRAVGTGATFLSRCAKLHWWVKNYDLVRSIRCGQISASAGILLWIQRRPAGCRTKLLMIKAGFRRSLNKLNHECSASQVLQGRHQHANASGSRSLTGDRRHPVLCLCQPGSLGQARHPQINNTTLSISCYISRPRAAWAAVRVELVSQVWAAASHGRNAGLQLKLESSSWSHHPVMHWLTDSELRMTELRLHLEGWGVL